MNYHTITAYKDKRVTAMDKGNYIDGHILLSSALHMARDNDLVVITAGCSYKERKIMEIRKAA